MSTNEPTAYLLVQQQAEDEGLWFDARTSAEAYLQQELRALHALIEAGQPSAPETAAPVALTVMAEAASADQTADTSGSFWLKHDDDLRYVRRVLEAGAGMTDGDQRAAINIVHGLRVMVRAEYRATEAKK